MKKTLAIILSLALVICMMPAAAFADTPAAPVALSASTVGLSETESTYTGSNITAPTVTFKNGVTYTEGTDYTVTWEKSPIKDAGAYKVTITTLDAAKLTGSCVLTYTVKPIDFSRALISYDGSTVKNDFDGFDNLKAGDTVTLPSGASVSVTGVGEFYETPVITKKDAKTIRISVSKKSDSENSNNVIGTAEKFIDITLTSSLSAYKIIGTGKDGAIPDAVYDAGKAQKPTVYVVPTANTGSSTANRLTEGKDYTLTYSDNTRGGCVASVTATGIDEYSGSISTSFNILTKDVDKLTVTANNTKKGSKPSFEVKDGSTVLTEGTDYSIDYYNSDTVGSGKGTATLVGRGNYGGTKVASFNVIDDDKIIKYSDVECTNKNVVYTGSSQEISTVVSLNGKKLTKGTDYTIKYYDNEAGEDKDKAVTPKNVSTYSVYLQGKGSYAVDSNNEKGLYLTSFTVTPISLDRITVNFSSSTKYDSSSKTNVPKVSLKASNGAVIPTTDYNVDYYGFNSSYRTQYVRVTPVAKGVKAEEQTVASTGSLTGGTGDRSSYIEADYNGATIDQTTAKNISVTVDKAYYYDGSKKETLTISSNSVSYAGEKIYLDISVYDGDSRRYLASYEYTVSYRDSDKKAVSYLYDADKYTLVIESTSNYEDKYNRNFRIEKSFEVKGRSISDYTVELNKYSETATGYSITMPTVKRVYKGSTGLSSSYYTVSYKDSNDKTITKASAPGTYKVVVTGKNGYSDNTYATFKIVGLSQSITGVESSYKVYPNDTLTLSPKATEGSFTYSSSDPSVATVSSTGVVTAYKAGRAKITITTTGNTKYDQVSKSTVIKVYPKKAVITKKPWTNGKKAQLKVRWNKQENVTRYEIRYSRAKNFKKGTYLTKKVNAANNDYTTQSTTIKNLKSGYTYYVKVRAVKEVYNDYGKKITYYGKWSGWRSVKVK